MAVSSTVAVFDFDHTLTTCDTLLPFLYFTHGKIETSYRLSTLTLKFIQFLCNRFSRQEMKEEILSTFYKGYPFLTLHQQGEKYANTQLDVYLRPEAIKRLKWHQMQKHRCLLVSASLDFYLNPWAKRQGFENVLCSQLKLNSSGEVTGKLKGLNCWGIEKQRRLLNYLGPDKCYELYVYGDSRGDREILQLADYPFYRTFHS